MIIIPIISEDRRQFNNYKIKKKEKDIVFLPYESLKILWCCLFGRSSDVTSGAWFKNWVIVQGQGHKMGNCSREWCVGNVSDVIRHGVNKDFRVVAERNVWFFCGVIVWDFSRHIIKSLFYCGSCSIRLRKGQAAKTQGMRQLLQHSWALHSLGKSCKHKPLAEDSDSETGSVFSSPLDSSTSATVVSSGSLL